MAIVLTIITLDLRCNNLLINNQRYIWEGCELSEVNYYSKCQFDG